MKVSTQNLTINFGTRTADTTNLLENLLENLLQSATLVSTYHGRIDDEDEHNAQQDATGETQHNPTQIIEEMVAKVKPQIVEFLQPNEKFTQRTWSALHKAICVTLGVYTHVLAQALRELVDEGVVRTKRRRADGETLYSAEVGAYVAVPPRQEQQETEQPELTVSELVDFLTSDERYEWRSLDAIRRHFDGSHLEDVLSLLTIAQSTDDVYKKTRADGTAAYKAA